MKFKKGFSLIEIMIVVGLIAILTAIGGTSYVNYSARARDGRRRTDMQNIRAALELFRSNNVQGTYPTVAQYTNMACPAGGGTQPALVCAGLLQVIPRDPRNQAYAYNAFSAAGGACNNGAIPCVTYTLTTDLEMVAGVNDYVLTPVSIN